MEVHERRRIVLATAFTLVALPAIWLFDRDDPAPGTAPNVAAVGVPEPLVAAGTEVPDTEPPMPVFLDNTVVLPAPAVIDVASPSTAPGNNVEGTATYQQFIDVMGTCTAPAAPSGATVSVTNVDNGLTLTCVNTLGVSIPYGVAVAIDTDLFTSIADLTDSPAPVRVSW